MPNPSAANLMFLASSAQKSIETYPSTFWDDKLRFHW
jgi:hypothetical protein